MILIYPSNNAGLIDIDTPINIIDFSIVGFLKENNILSMYFMTSSEDGNQYLLKSSFKIEDADKKFLEHPLLKVIDISTYSKSLLNAASVLISSMGQDQCYYSTFSMESYILKSEKDCTVSCLGYGINKINSHATMLNMPFSIYSKIVSIISGLALRQPINPVVDKTQGYNDYELYFIDRVTYLGQKVVLGKGAIIFFEFETKNNKKVGVAVPIDTSGYNGSILNTYDDHIFMDKYQDNMIANLTNMKSISIKGKTYLYLERRTDPKSYKFYIMTDVEILDSPFINPFKLFKEG